MHERLISSQHATLIACTTSLLERNITVCMLRPHSAHAYPHAHCASVAALGRSKFTGVVDREGRHYIGQCLPSLSKSLTSVRWSRRHLTKYQFRPASPAQANNRARRTHLSRIPIQPDLSAWLRSRPKVASARPKLASTGRARLRRAACAAAAGLLQARTEHHDRVVAPRWLPARLRRAGCSRPLLSR
jgi:hypothetical protein